MESTDLSHVSDMRVHIAILEKVHSFDLSCETDYTLVNMKTDERKIIPYGTTVVVESDERGIIVGKNVFSGSVKVIPKNEDEFLQVNGRRYRNTILLNKNSGNQLTVINELSLDHYLCGVLPKEVGPNWPAESLKAQAIVSRTFTLKNFNRHSSDGFQLCSRVHCQVYGGLEEEREESNWAVKKTQNEVLTYKGEPIHAVFFSNCGGRTEFSVNVWETNSKMAYLKSVRCRYCKNEAHYRWEKEVTQEEIVQALRKNKLAITKPIRSIQIASYGKSGRAKFLKVVHHSGKTNLRANQFRLALGAETIRSTLFSKIKKKKGKFYFQGRGWGHGVGMCQEGAKGYAESGASYKKILSLYYPKTKVEKWEEEESKENQQSSSERMENLETGNLGN